MAPVPPPAFRDLLGECSRSELAAFVGGLWEARGRTVTREGDRILVDGATELRPVVAPGSDALAAPEGTVVVTAVDPPADAEGVVGPSELRRVLLYDVPRERAAGLFERHFDRPLDDDWPTPRPSRPGGDGTGAAGGREVAARVEDETGEPSFGTVSGLLGLRPAVVVAGPLLVVLAAGLLVPWGPAVGPLGGPGEEAAVAGPTVAPTSTLPPPVQFQPGDHTVRTPTTAPRSGAYPLGLDSEGVENAAALADAHATAVSGRSYELVVRYREYHDGAPLGAVRETVRVADRTTYVTDVATAGTLASEPAGVAGAEVYADGTRVYTRRLDTREPAYTARNVSAPASGEDPFADRVEGVLEARLADAESGVVGSYRRHGRTYHLLEFRGDRAVGSALVDEHGVVHELQWRYTPSDSPRVTAEVTMGHRFGPVTVAPPSWLDAARNATDG
jgi:hypothetical protein